MTGVVSVWMVGSGIVPPSAMSKPFGVGEQAALGKAVAGQLSPDDIYQLNAWLDPQLQVLRAGAQ